MACGGAGGSFPHSGAHMPVSISSTLTAYEEVAWEAEAMLRTCWRKAEQRPSQVTLQGSVSVPWCGVSEWGAGDGAQEEGQRKEQKVQAD